MDFLANWLRKMGDQADGWKNDGDSWSYLRPVQFRSMEDLQAIADVMTEHGGVARFTLGGYNPKSLSEIEQTADADLNQIWIAAFAEDPGPEAVTLSGSFAWVCIVNGAFIRDTPGGLDYLTIYVGKTLQDTVSSSGAIRQLTVSKLSKRVLRGCESVRSRDGHYPVIDTITKSTLKQRQHDRKVRWQAALISVVTTLLTTGAVHVLFPQAAGK